ncbi:hypothetical protein R5W24_005892 [Gemmata sp. JC717]|uniref:hypothetical protein n=1 Tax=Gemmata algarum TaxID=2975278 RepID=UPI0021BBB05A|nr:hypothetical protein [Gemmata algarum]MDY3556722.1 hypothetical protein [Gemmata algarum]
MLRRVLLGCVCVVSAVGAVSAAPPGLQPRPHVEGREIDPVARDHFLPESPAVVSEPPALPAQPRAEGDAFWVLLFGAHEAVLNKFTMPLGTARFGDM